MLYSFATQVTVRLIPGGYTVHPKYNVYVLLNYFKLFIVKLFMLKYLPIPEEFQDGSLPAPAILASPSNPPFDPFVGIRYPVE